MSRFTKDFLPRIGLVALTLAVTIRGQQDIPTLVPPASFSPATDAQLLRNALQGPGTDQQQIIDILCRRVASQRAVITSTYNSQFNRDLVADLQAKTLAQDFKDLCVSLTRSMSDFLAVELYTAMDERLGTDEPAINEILMSRTNLELDQIRNDFVRKYGITLNSVITANVQSESLQLLFFYMAEGYRREDSAVDMELVMSDARKLYYAAEGSLNGTDANAFAEVFGQRSYPHLIRVSDAYGNLSSYTLRFIIETFFRAGFRDSLLSILDYASSKHAYFAQRLKQTTAGLGTDEQSLSRQVVSRCETDLGSIKTQYESIFGTSLASDVSGDTSGSYRSALLVLIG